MPCAKFHLCTFLLKGTYQPRSGLWLGETDFPHPKVREGPRVSGGTCPGVGDCLHTAQGQHQRLHSGTPSGGEQTVTLWPETGLSTTRTLSLYFLGLAILRRVSNWVCLGHIATELHIIASRLCTQAWLKCDLL